jgi:hypothetical protein
MTLIYQEGESPLHNFPVTLIYQSPATHVIFVILAIHLYFTVFHP